MSISEQDFIPSESSTPQSPQNSGSVFEQNGLLPPRLDSTPPSTSGYQPRETSETISYGADATTHVAPAGSPKKKLIYWTIIFSIAVFVLTILIFPGAISKSDIFKRTQLLEKQPEISSKKDLVQSDIVKTVSDDASAVQTANLSQKIIPSKPDSDFQTDSLPSRLLYYAIPPSLWEDYNVINELYPSQKDFKAYQKKGSDNLVPLVYIDRWDRDAEDGVMAKYLYGKDEGSFKAFLRSKKIVFEEENLIVDGRSATLIYVGKTAKESSFYCSVIQTVNGDFYTYTLSPQNRDDLQNEIKLFEKILGGVKYRRAEGN